VARPGSADMIVCRQRLQMLIEANGGELDIAVFGYDIDDGPGALPAVPPQRQGETDPALNVDIRGSASPAETGSSTVVLNPFSASGQASWSSDLRADQVWSNISSARYLNMRQPYAGFGDTTSTTHGKQAFGSGPSVYQEMVDARRSSMRPNAGKERGPMQPLQSTSEGPILSGEENANQYVLEDERASSGEEPPATRSVAEQNLLRTYRNLPGGAYFARALVDRPDWLGPDEIVTKLHNGQVVPVTWIPEATAFAKPVSGYSFEDRYTKGVLIASNAMLQAPLVDESLKGYMVRQRGVVRRTDERDRELSDEYTEWYRHKDT